MYTGTVYSKLLCRESLLGKYRKSVVPQSVEKLSRYGQVHRYSITQFLFVDVCSARV